MFPWGLLILFVIGSYIWGPQYKNELQGQNVIYPQFHSFKENSPIPQNRQQMGAMGGYITKTNKVRYGQVIPQNTAQGYSRTNTLGREAMYPQNYMVPDNFNNHPANFYLNQPSIDL